jgi:hypothetical protein
MALSDARALALFEILETPYYSGYFTLDGMGTLAASTEISAATQGQAKEEIIDFVATNIEATAGLLTVLNARLDKWIAIDTQTGRIEAGGVGSISGVTANFTEERELIKAKVKNMIPFFRHHEVLARRLGAANANSGPGANGGFGSIQVIR